MCCLSSCALSPAESHSTSCSSWPPPLSSASAGTRLTSCWSYPLSPPSIRTSQQLSMSLPWYRVHPPLLGTSWMDIFRWLWRAALSSKSKACTCQLESLYSILSSTTWSHWEASMQILLPRLRWCVRCMPLCVYGGRLVRPSSSFWITPWGPRFASWS